MSFVGSHACASRQTIAWPTMRCTGATRKSRSKRRIPNKKPTKSAQKHSGRLTRCETNWNRDAFSDKAVLLPVLFLVAWQGTPSSGSALFFFETNELGFKPEFLGRLSLISSISSLAGIVAYDQYLKKIPLKVLFKWVCISGVVLGMTPLILVTHLNRAIGLPDTWFAIGDDVILTVWHKLKRQTPIPGT